MPRKKISEFRAKTILYASLGQSYPGVSLDIDGDEWREQIKQLPGTQRYVAKIDEGVKGRFKKGLVALDRTVFQLPTDVAALAKKGYRYVLIEPYQEHPQSAEYYLAIDRQRAGNVVMFSKLGGVNVENSASSIKHEQLNPENTPRIERSLTLPKGTLDTLGEVFDSNYFSFLEINPLVVTGREVQFLDAAVEVDDQAAPLVNERWSPSDIRDASAKTPEEEAVEELGARSQASFSLKVLNPNGAVFLLLSGGGASIVVADAVAGQGYGKELANYGEYSGNPNEEETYLYTKQVISLMLKSASSRKVMIISGGVANFTDVRITFRGVVRALDEAKSKLRKQGIKVFVRRGGPFEKEGLRAMGAFLEKEGLIGQVAGPELTLSDIIPSAVASLETKA